MQELVRGQIAMLASQPSLAPAGMNTGYAIMTKGRSGLGAAFLTEVAPRSPFRSSFPAAAT